MICSAALRFRASSVCIYTAAGIGTLLGPPLAGAAYDAYGSYSAPILAPLRCADRRGWLAVVARVKLDEIDPKRKQAPRLVVSEERGGAPSARRRRGDPERHAARDPYALELAYTRCMMAFLLFQPEPRRALMIGLGGGSLANFSQAADRLAHHVVEYDERVIATARALSHVPADDARLQIEHGDGVSALAPECCDLLVVDGYEDEATPAALVSQAFFDAAWCALEEPGALVVNFMDDDRDFDRHLQRLERAFGGAVLAFRSLRARTSSSSAEGLPAALNGGAARARRRAERKYGLPFPRYVSGCGR